MSRPKAPTLEEIQRKFTSAQRFWQRLHAEQMTDYEFFQLKKVINVPTGFNAVMPATANSVVITAADHVAGDAPVVKVPEANLSIKAAERSERLEKGLQAAMYRFSSSYANDPIRSLIVNGLWSGMLVSQGPIFDPDAWGLVPVRSDYQSDEAFQEAQKEYDAVKRRQWPFFWRVPDPRYVYPDPGTAGRKWVIVRYQRDAGSIKAQWPRWDMTLGGQEVAEDTLIDFLEYWDEYYRAYLVGAAGHAAGYGPVTLPADASSGSFLLKPVRHYYGKPPFQIRTAGYGSDSGLPHERFRSILYPARSMLEQEMRFASQLDGIMRQNAWPQMVTIEGSGFDALEPGTVKGLRSLQDVEATRPIIGIKPEVITALISNLQYIEGQIEQATFPAVVQGIRARGVTSGYGQNSLVAQAKVRFGTVARATQSLLAEFLTDFLLCVKNVVEEPVPVWGPTRNGFVDQVIDPRDIPDSPYIVVTINPKLPADRANEVAIGQVLLQLGAIDKDTFLQDFAGYEQPEEMRTRIMRDRALESPEIQRIIQLSALLRLGFMEEIFGRAQELGIDPSVLLQSMGLLQQPGMQQPGMQPPVGVPQIPGVAPQLAGGVDQALGTSKTQPVPGTIRPVGPQAQTRDAAVPGLPIRTAA